MKDLEIPTRQQNIIKAYITIYRKKQLEIERIYLSELKKLHSWREKKLQEAYVEFKESLKNDGFNI